LIEAARSGNTVAVRNTGGITVDVGMDGINVIITLRLDVGVGGVRITQSWEVNAGPITSFLAGKRIPLTESPVPVVLIVGVE
jgi:hypothetical protein